MINLIPNEQKKKITVNFYYKIITVVFFMFGTAVLVATFLILPSYVLSSIKLDITVQKLDSQNKEPIPEVDQKTLSVLNALNSKLDLLEKSEKGKYLVSNKIINEVISKKVDGIKINHISYDSSATGQKIVNVGGIASSREKLLLFRQSFEDYAAFKDINLPISSFIKGSNIEFNLSLSPL
ncbi:MAG: hypothetical protein WCI41_00575 [bacterium]